MLPFSSSTSHIEPLLLGALALPQYSGLPSGVVMR